MFAVHDVEAFSHPRNHYGRDRGGTHVLALSAVFGGVPLLFQTGEEVVANVWSASPEAISIVIELLIDPDGSIFLEVILVSLV